MGELRKRLRGVRSVKHFFQKCVAVAMRGPMRWYEEDRLGGVLTKKQENYRLERDGLLTEGRKKEILTDVCRRELGYAVDWDEPKSFNEKIMWLKLNYQDPLITRCCDKYAVKGYVTEVLGPAFTVPTIGRWSDPDEIDFDALPDQFVLKVNWSSGMNIIVPDKSRLDRDEARKKLKGWLSPEQNSYYQTFNWGYKHMAPVVYAEEYISEIGDSTQIYDYKFFCYDGVCKNIFITTDRFTNKTYNWFDRDFNELPFTYGRVGKTKGGVKKPKHYEDMVVWAEKLSRPFPFVRVDFYEIGDRVMVGEMTFYCGGGILAFHPREWDYKLGELIQLPQPVYFDGRVSCEALPAREAYLREERITEAEKRRFCEQRYFDGTLTWPDLAAPEKYSEKVLWLALHGAGPEAARAADAWELRALAAERLGERYAAPVLGVYDDVDAIDLAALPESFTARSTAVRGGGRTLTVSHKRYQNEGLFRARAAEWLCPWNTFYYENMCVTAERIAPRILIEPVREGGKLHRFLCLDGVPRLYRACGAAGEALELENWSEVPGGTEKLAALAGKLAAGFPAAVVDIVEDGENIYISGLDVYPGLFERIDPLLDRRLGGLVHLENIGGSEG